MRESMHLHQGVFCFIEQRKLSTQEDWIAGILRLVDIVPTPLLLLSLPLDKLAE